MSKATNKEREKDMSEQQIEERDEEQSVVMKAKSFRCEDELWDDAMRIATERGDNVSAMLRATLRRYVKRHSA